MNVRWIYRVAVALAAVLFAAGMTGGGIALAAGDSLPGELLYPIKLAAEDARLSLTRAPPALASLNLAFAGRRVREAQELTEKGRELPEGALARLARHTEHAIDQISRVESAQAPVLLEEVAEKTLAHGEALEQARAAAPEEAQEGLDRALQLTRRAYLAAGGVLGEVGLSEEEPASSGVGREKGNEASIGVTGVLSDTEEEGEDEDGLTGLAFHPVTLGARGGCRTSYQASTGLKNHGTDLATGVTIEAQIVPGGWDGQVEVTPSGPFDLGKGKPKKVAVSVDIGDGDGWLSAGEGAAIEVKLVATSAEGLSAEATLLIENECQRGDEDEDADEDEADEKDEDKDGMTGLVFHPAHLNAGGKCRELYVARGSLKNHGPDLATGFVIAAEVVSGTGWASVEVTPMEWDELGTSKPGRFTVEVSTNDDWPSAGKGSVIQVRVYVVNAVGVSIEGGEAIFTVRNQCKDESLKGTEESEKPDKPGKPEKAPKEPPPGKPEKPGKPPKPGKPDKGE